MNSSVFIWKYLNRTIYRSSAFEGADEAFLWHLRNKRPEPNAEELALHKEFNLKIVYPSELFYRTHKISQKDFLEKLRELRKSSKGEEAVQETIMDLFSDESISGRRGVKSLSQGIAIV